MKYFDIESYIDGTLTGKLLEEFENELRTNPNFLEEVNSQKQLSEDLKNIELKNRVAKALKFENENSSAILYSNKIVNIVLIILAIILGSFIIYPYIFPEGKQSVQPSENESIIAPTINDSVNITPKIFDQNDQKQNKKKKYKFAQKEETLKQVKKVKPILRSLNDTSNLNKALLKSFISDAYLPTNTVLSTKFDKINVAIRTKNYSKAFARLQHLERNEQNSDTITFLKSYCLLNMGEGEEAVRILEGLETTLPQWHGFIEWYRCSGYILLNDKEEARIILQKIISNKEHIFNKKANSILQTLD